MSYVNIAIAVGSAGLTAYQADRTNTKQQNLINQQAEAANATKKKQNSILLEELEGQNTDRNDQYNEESGQIADSLTSAVKNSFLNTDTSSIAPSSDYARANASAKAASAKDALKKARLKGNANGVSRLFANEGEGLSRANTDMLLEGNYGAGESNLYTNKINNVQANPYVTALASAASSYAGTKA